MHEDRARIERMLSDLRSTGRLKVTDGSKTFWILCRSWCGGHPYGYAASRDGKRPADKYRLYSDDQLWGWLGAVKLA